MSALPITNCRHGTKGGEFCSQCGKVVIIATLNSLIGANASATIINGKVTRFALDDITQPIDTRWDQALRHLGRYLTLPQCTIHCITEPTRTGAGSWVRIFTGGFHETEEPWIIDLTASIAEVLSLKTETRYYSETWLFIKVNGTTNRPIEIAERLTAALNRKKGSIKARYL